MYALANPRRRRAHHRRHHRRNPGLEAIALNPRHRRHHHRHHYRRNPSIGGASMEEAGGVVLGAVGTAYVDSILGKPLLGGLAGSLGQFSGALTAVASAWGFHQVMKRVSAPWGRRTATGGATYAVIAIANSLMPGLIPITVGVPSQLAGLNPFSSLLPAAAAKPALAGGGPAGTTSSQTGGLRIVSRMGL